MTCVSSQQSGEFFNSSFSGDGRRSNNGISVFYLGRESFPLSVSHCTFDHFDTAIATRVGASSVEGAFVARWNVFRRVQAAVKREGAFLGTVVFEHNDIMASAGSNLAYFDIEGSCSSRFARRTDDVSIRHNTVTNCNASASAFVLQYSRFENTGRACLIENNTFIGNNFADSAIKVDVSPARAYRIRHNNFTDNRGGSMIQLVSSGDVGTEVGLHNNTFNSSLATFDIASNVLLGQAIINASYNHWSVPQAAVQARISSSYLPRTFQPIIVEPVGSVIATEIAVGPLQLPDGSLGGMLAQNLTLTGAVERFVSTTIHVAANTTLTLSAGLVLRFASDAQLIVDGGLVSLGTHDLPVLMLPQSSMLASDVRQGIVVAEERPIESVGMYETGSGVDQTSIRLSSSCSQGCNSQALCSAACLERNYNIFRTGTITVSGGTLSGTCFCGANMTAKVPCSQGSPSRARWYAVAMPLAWKGLVLAPTSRVNLTGATIVAAQPTAIVSQSASLSVTNSSIYLTKELASRWKRFPLS